MVADEQQNIRVFVRVRPNNRRELELNQRTVVKPIDSGTLLFDPDDDEDEFFYQGVKQTHRDITKRVRKKISMEFNGVFDEEATNENVFQECTKPLVAAVMNGYNCSVFVYGATGAGKTFTMLGNEDSQGITYLTMQELFRGIEELSDTRKFDIGISYLEVYNELVRNLLTRTGPLKLREDVNGVVVSGLVLKPIHSAEELLNLLALGNKNRTQHATDANAESSRSHAIFQVHIRMSEKKTGQKRTVKLSMIDLAGSERAASTKGIGERFKEGASINKSLLALGNCINKLADGQKHIPYRDSNLTRILKDSLGGNCQTVMIANVSPSSLTYEDTYNTLKYASRAKKIRTTIRQNVLKTNMPKDYYVKKTVELQDEVERLKRTIKQLEEKVQNNSTSNSQSKSFDNAELVSWYRKIDAVYSSIIKSQEYLFSVRSKEKILKLRIKLREHVEEIKRILTLDGFKLEGAIARIEASIDQFNKHITKQQHEVSRWLERYHEALKDLEPLRIEIAESKYSTILSTYLKGKDTEVNTSALNIRMNHVIKLNSILTEESDRFRKVLKISCDANQYSYLLIRSTNNLDGNLQEKLDKILNMVSGQQITFEDNDRLQTESDESSEFSNISLENINNLSDVHMENGDKNEGNNKRRHDSNDENAQQHGKITQGLRSKKLFKVDIQDIASDCQPLPKNDQDDVFKLPSIMKQTPNLNETQVLVPTTGRQNPDFIKSILTEKNVNATNREAISKVLIKSSSTRQHLLTKVQSTLNKENKKFSPNRIRKSPRPAVRNLTTRVFTTGANLLGRQRTKSANQQQPTTENGAIKINRTTSMRLKK